MGDLRGVLASLRHALSSPMAQLDWPALGCSRNPQTLWASRHRGDRVKHPWARPGLPSQLPQGGVCNLQVILAGPGGAVWVILNGEASLAWIGRSPCFSFNCRAAKNKSQVPGSALPRHVQP